MDGLDIFNVYIMGSIEMLTVFHFFTRFLKKKVKFIYIVCLSWNDDYDVFSNRQYYGIIGICSAVDGRRIFYM